MLHARVGDGVGAEIRVFGFKRRGTIVPTVTVRAVLGVGFLLLDYHLERRQSANNGIASEGERASSGPLGPARWTNSKGWRGSSLTALRQWQRERDPFDFAQGRLSISQQLRWLRSCYSVQDDRTD